MPTFRWPVAAALVPYVDSIVGFDYVLDPDAVHHGLPSTSLTTVIAFDEPLAAVGSTAPSGMPTGCSLVVCTPVLRSSGRTGASTASSWG